MLLWVFYNLLGLRSVRKREDERRSFMLRRDDVYLLNMPVIMIDVWSRSIDLFPTHADSGTSFTYTLPYE